MTNPPNMGFKEYLQEKGVAFPLAIIRFMLAFMLIWSVLDKIFGLGMPVPQGQGLVDGGTPIIDYLSNPYGPFKDFFKGMAETPFWSILFMVGSICISIGLITGWCTKITTISACVMFFILYLADFPTDNPFLSYKLIYIVAMWAIYVGKGYDCISLSDRWKNLEIVKRHPILE